MTRPAAFVVGLDLSLTSAGLCVIPTAWEVCDWSRVVCRTIAPEERGASAVERVERIRKVWAGILQETEFTGAKAELHFFCEGYSFGSANRAHHLGELGGFVRGSIYELSLKRRVTLHNDVPPASWRKLLLGKNPRTGAKQAAHDMIRAAGLITSTGDEADAFGVANFGLTKLGFVSMGV